MLNWTEHAASGKPWNEPPWAICPVGVWSLEVCADEEGLWSYRIWDSEAGAGEAWLISYENDALKTFTTEDAAKQACEAHLKRVLTEALNVLEGGK